ncbi:MAG: tRNA pseudouridine synthase B, partial [Burkholderiales bacterium]
KLGETTATGDAEGAVLVRKEVDVPASRLAAVLARFRGAIDQLPPMHSALKRDGVPLYRLARRGETVERKPRRVRILALDLLRFEPPRLEIRLRCSKGTYVRTLAEDIGAALGTGAHLAALRRTASGGFSVDDAIRLERLEAMPAELRQSRLQPLSALLAGLPRAELDATSEARLRQGQALKISGLRSGLCAVYGPGGAVVGLGRAESEVLRPLRLTQAAEKHVKSRA